MRITLIAKYALWAYLILCAIVSVYPGNIPLVFLPGMIIGSIVALDAIFAIVGRGKARIIQAILP